MPVLVARGSAPIRFEGIGVMLLEPPVDVVVVELLGPQHPGKRLAHDIRLVGG